MKKILIIQNHIPPYRIGFFNELGKYFDVTILHSGQEINYPSKLFKEEIVPVKKIGPFSFQKKAYKQGKSINYEAVILMFDLAWIWSMMLILFGRKNIILWGHRYSSNNIANKLRNFLMKRKSIKAIVQYSWDEHELLEKAGIKSDKIFVAPNTMLIPNSKNLSSAYKNSFLFVGRAQIRKKVDHFIKAFAEIQNDIHRDIKINIIGSGSVNDELKKLGEELGISKKLTFTGEINDPDILKSYFKSAIAYVSPGAVGLGVLHSFSYGVPMVTYRNERHGPEFSNLTNDNSIVCDTFEDLKMAIKKFASDPSFAQKLGNNAFKHFNENRSIENMTRGFVNAINQ